MKKTIGGLKKLQADSIVLYMKVHNYHWNVKGADFPQAHKALEGIYEDFADMFDDLAERIVQLGEVPVVTLSEALKTSKIKEETKTSFSSKEVLKEVLKIYQHLQESFIDLAKSADKDDDRVTAAYCDEQLAKLEKSIWMIKVQLA
ncbi:DNA starvation/stationary phase protection protein [Helicobacter fennelliae]|uniref:Non-specific DNA-binding protein Dps / Iron-binding ferritin-like antioxidant protein / Ferroxidase n=2 Tax=Helicobacter fennelliae TaxID=215 RepID=T1CSJ5_9HELI|nr:DNA starvation/stationary phase protection protein [Helicobacter fennelliae]GAD19779.1 non-specific DNA-binding protein Dps / Iron-binding ferritin-like antioxidant protein / Ferroxidase [Helicobacter fennelliae MRY12-0050]SQB98686.1 neutrophil activating protein [Helicobacter fennelliae]STP08027.1 neutrophil activating protein [Helicobacter fennelliae]STQ84064.1 neutrophil activating protein [Helicobacter fennelliae]